MHGPVHQEHIIVMLTGWPIRPGIATASVAASLMLVTEGELISTA